MTRWPLVALLGQIIGRSSMVSGAAVLAIDVEIGTLHQ